MAVGLAREIRPPSATLTIFGTPSLGACPQHSLPGRLSTGSVRSRFGAASARETRPVDEMEVVVGRRRGQTWRQVGYGVYRRRTAENDDSVGGAAWAGSADPAEEHARRRRQRLADLHAWQEILPASGSFTHLTAAEAHGLWLPPLPDGLPVMVALPKTEARPKRPELRVLRSAPVEVVTVDGLRLASVPETLLACARDLGLLDLV